MSEAYVFDAEQLEYKAAWDLQLKLCQMRIVDAVPDVLLLLEHPHVFTVGRRGTIQNVCSEEIPIYEIERGGDVTYHGPGQLVGYPIVSLQHRARDLHLYLRDLEEVIIGSVSEFGIKAEKHPGHTGVWVGKNKLASIGVAVRSWVTYHGFALNVNTDMSYFERIRPCGLDSSVMTSMHQLTGSKISMNKVKTIVSSNFARVFRKELTTIPNLQDILHEAIPIL